MSYIKKLFASVTIRGVVTLVLTGVYAYLALSSFIDANSFVQVYLLIIGFYFGNSTKSNGIEDQSIIPN